ncbi:MAG TPA: hypothetical protein VHV54_10600, partial [Candidatus Binatia bacterium]|nr:hypothetical protein [Candidatus Binatia bacterium]
RQKAKKRKGPPRPPLCPECNSNNVVPDIHGVITSAIQRRIDAGRAIHADREEWEGMTQWFCKACGCDWSRHSRRFKKPGGVNATRA